MHFSQCTNNQWFSKKLEASNSFWIATGFNLWKFLLCHLQVLPDWWEGHQATVGVSRSTWTASGGQYVRHTGPTVMPVSFADSLDLGEGRLTDYIMLTTDMWRGLVKTIVVKNWIYCSQSYKKGWLSSILLQLVCNMSRSGVLAQTKFWIVQLASEHFVASYH